MWGKMLAYCVQDATVVDVEKRRNPSKHYVSTPPRPLREAGQEPPEGPLGGPSVLSVVSPGAERLQGSLWRWSLFAGL